MVAMNRKTFAHISVMYPEFGELDSVYIDSRGFPAPVWVSNDPAISGYGDKKTELYWRSFLFNGAIFTTVLFVVELFIATIVWFFAMLIEPFRSKQLSSQPEAGDYSPKR